MLDTPVIRILIVDDKPVVHEGVKVFLKIFDDLECVGVAVNGKDALAKCETLKPDVVLMDIVMPEMNGIEATHMIRDQYPEITVIGLTSVYDDSAQQTAMISAGAIACLPKNASIHTIEATIRDAMKKRDA